MQALAELDTVMTRRDAIEEAVAQLPRERDAVVVESTGVQAIRKNLEEANEDVEPLTNNVDEFYHANLMQFEHLYNQ